MSRLSTCFSHFSSFTSPNPKLFFRASLLHNEFTRRKLKAMPSFLMNHHRGALQVKASTSRTVFIHSSRKFGFHETFFFTFLCELTTRNLFRFRTWFSTLLRRSSTRTAFLRALTSRSTFQTDFRGFLSLPNFYFCSEGSFAVEKGFSRHCAGSEFSSPEQDSVNRRSAR